MKERPILFSGPMVRAILEGRKTQTRRVVKWPKSYQPHELEDAVKALNRSVFKSIGRPGPCDGLNDRLVCPYTVGQRLWVRETWARVHPGMLQSLDPDPDSHEWSTVYRADENGGYVGRMLECTKWRPSIHMPRWASRITLEITTVRVERLHEITEEDAKAEGLEMMQCRSEWFWKAYGHNPLPDGGEMMAFRDAKKSFQTLWTSINGPGSWTANPYVWVVEFRKVEDKR